MGACLPLDRRADAGKQLISCGVPRLGVDRAEAVYIEQRNREGAPVTLGAADVELELGAKRAQRQERPRERVA